MAQKGVTHPVTESCKCTYCLQKIEDEDPILFDCGESICGHCLLQCEVIRDKATCNGCCWGTNSTDRLQNKDYSNARCALLSFLAKEVGIKGKLFSALRDRNTIKHDLELFSKFVVESVMGEDKWSEDQAFKKLVLDLLHAQYGPLLLCLPRDLEEKYDDLVAAQISVIHFAYICLMWDSHGTAKGSSCCPAVDVWTKLNPLLEAVSERDRALKALLDTTMAAKKSESSRSLTKVLEKGRTVTFVKSKRRYEVFKKAVTCYKLNQDTKPFPTTTTTNGSIHIPEGL